VRGGANVLQSLPAARLRLKRRRESSRRSVDYCINHDANDSDGTRLLEIWFARLMPTRRGGSARQFFPFPAAGTPGSGGVGGEKWMGARDPTVGRWLRCGRRGTACMRHFNEFPDSSQPQVACSRRSWRHSVRRNRSVTRGFKRPARKRRSTFGKFNIVTTMRTVYMQF